MAETPIRWTKANFIGTFDKSPWVFVNASIGSDGELVIGAGGSATLELTAEVDIEFKYLKVNVTFFALNLSKENNYRNKPTIKITEIYKDVNNEIDSVKIRSIGLNTTNASSINKYFDSTICTTNDRKMAKMKIVIQNETDTALTLYSLNMYQSEDVSTTVVNRVVNTVQKSISAENIKVYRNEDNSINGLGIFIPGTTVELMFRPAYFNGQLIAIDTNFGQTVSVQNIREKITFL